MRQLLLALVPLAIAADLGAQVIRRGSLGVAPPAAWASLGIGQTNGWTVNDGATGSVWEFGNAVQYGASLERAGGGFSYGVRGTTSMVPLRYRGTDANGGALTTDGDANVSQLLASVHVASGRGFHTVVAVDAGATHYSNFRQRDTGVTLRPSSDTDFTFAFGYGFGYGVSNRFTIEVVQELSTILHQRTGLSGGEDTNDRVNVTRIAGRFGLGQRR